MQEAAADALDRLFNSPMRLGGWFVRRPPGAFASGQELRRDATATRPHACNGSAIRARIPVPRPAPSGIIDSLRRSTRYRWPPPQPLRPPGPAGFRVL